MLGAKLALLQVHSEPRAVSFRNAFHASLGDQLECAPVNAFAHDAAPPWSAPRSASSPRYKHDFTVDSGTLSTPAISSICNSSWQRRTSTSRYTAGIIRIDV